MRTRRPRPFTTARIERIAVAHLGRYPCTRAHLRAVLVRRIRRQTEPGPEREEAEARIDGVIATLAGGGLIDDRAVARDVVRRLRRRGASNRALRSRLREKRVPDALWSDALATEEEDDDPELRAALVYARRRRFGPFRRATDPAPEEDDVARATRRRELAALGRAGFPLPVALRVLDHVADEVGADVTE